MKRKKIFSKGLSVLIVAVIAVLAFVRGPELNWVLACVFGVWAIVMIIAAISSNKARISAYSDARKIKRENRRNNKNTLTSALTPTAEWRESSATLLSHVNHRISAYLLSVYPGITWEWVSDNPEHLVTTGTPARIRLFGITDFNYADVHFDKYARIACDMLRVVPLSELDVVEGVPKAHPNQSVDPTAWYNLHGKTVLEGCIADLNSRGHANLTIKESGDICVKQADMETVRDKLQNFPDKNYWKALVQVFEKAGLAATIEPQGIKVSW